MTPVVWVPSIMLNGKDGHRPLLNHKDNAVREIRHASAPNTRLGWPEPIWFFKDLGDRGLHGVHETGGRAACLRVVSHRVEKLGPSALTKNNLVATGDDGKPTRKRLTNGEALRVQKIEGDRTHLESNGKPEGILDASTGLHLTYGYVITSNAAQGKTVRLGHSLSSSARLIGGDSGTLLRAVLACQVRVQSVHQFKNRGQRGHPADGLPDERP